MEVEESEIERITKWLVKNKKLIESALEMPRVFAKVTGYYPLKMETAIYDLMTVKEKVQDLIDKILYLEKD